ATSKILPTVVEIATGLAGSTLSNSSTGLSRINANEFPWRTSILIISGDSLYIHCITIQALIFYPNIRWLGESPEPFALQSVGFWIQAVMSNKRFRSTKRIEGCDGPCGEARAVAFACGTIATHSRAIFTEGVDQTTKRLL